MQAEIWVNIFLLSGNFRINTVYQLKEVIFDKHDKIFKYLDFNSIFSNEIFIYFVCTSRCTYHLRANVSA